MTWWERRVVPRLVEHSCALPALDPWRQRTSAGLRGHVVEIGFGSGLNLPHLPPDVVDLAAVEPSDLAWSLSAERRRAAGVEIRRVGSGGASVPLADATCDAVLCTFTLCTVPEPVHALAEARRLLRPGGRLHLLEHGLAPSPRVAAWQRRLDPLQRRVAGGCHLTRDVLALTRGAGFDVDGLEQDHLPGPALSRPWGYLTRIEATAPALAGA